MPPTVLSDLKNLPPRKIPSRSCKVKKEPKNDNNIKKKKCSPKPTAKPKPKPRPKSAQSKQYKFTRPINIDRYTDFSQIPDPEPISVGRGGVSDPFHQKLHRMLSYVEEHQMTDIVSFLPHGRAFVIKDDTRFTDEIMPLFFGQTKLITFLRQLHKYGFKKKLRGNDLGCYYHELFLRGRPGLCVNMMRASKHEGSRSNLVEPDFHDMPPLPQISPAIHADSATSITTAVTTSTTSSESTHTEPSSNDTFTMPPLPQMPPTIYAETVKSSSTTGTTGTTGTSSDSTTPTKPSSSSSTTSTTTTSSDSSTPPPTAINAITQPSSNDLYGHMKEESI